MSKYCLIEKSTPFGRIVSPERMVGRPVRARLVRGWALANPQRIDALKVLESDWKLFRTAMLSGAVATGKTRDEYAMRTNRNCICLIAVLALGWLPGLAGAADSLHEQIDALIAAKAGGPVAPPASDAEFLRRVYLDLAGTIPSSDDARKFLEDPSPDKRAQLIDKLLASPHFSKHMGEAFDVMLMERRSKGDSEWRRYLEASFAANKPWDQLTREILCPNPEDPATKFSSMFYYTRLAKVGQNPTDYPLVTRDVGRLFLGVDLKCCQCHNHKYIKDYKQVDFQGLMAIIGTTFIRTDVKGTPTIGEKPLLKKVDFVSVFHPDEKFEVGPRVPFGTEMPIPAVAKGEEWATPPNPKTKFPGIPKFDTLKILAEQTANANNEQFKKNIANRLWFLMMGRGLVNPLDLSHSENPPSHPELLTLLADHIAANHFDMKELIHELALTQTYQRSSILPSGDARVPPESYRVAIAKRVSPEQMARAMLMATGQLEAIKAVKETKVKFVAKDMDADVNELDANGTKAAGPVPIGVVNEKFVGAFGAPKGEAEIEFAPSVAGALFVSNEKMILGWLQPAPGNLVYKMSKLNDARAVADELYLSVLTRLPTDDERADVAAFLARNGKDHDTAISEMTWALLASTEFCVNH